ncbi:MAG: PhoH family protein [Alphaproteobacteria bacterium]
MTTLPVPDETRSVHLELPENALLPALFGEHDGNLRQIEEAFGVAVTSRGNRVAIVGPPAAAAAARETLEALYRRLERGLAVETGEVAAAIRAASAGGGEMPSLWTEELTIRTRKRPITPRSPTQAAYIRALRRNALVFGLGPAGTGKTYLAVACAVDRLIAGKVDRIILSRPAVEAGERLGFLPGDLREKVDPYLRPLYDALHDMLPGDQIAKRMASGEIEVAPLAFMRGRTLADAFVILDEAQNTTPIQMKMFLTRLGENAQMAVTGDLSQVDLPSGTRSGLSDALETLDGVEGIDVVRFGAADVVRHPLVARIVRAYDAREAAKR